MGSKHHSRLMEGEDVVASFHRIEFADAGYGNADSKIGDTFYSILDSIPRSIRSRGTASNDDSVGGAMHFLESFIALMDCKFTSNQGFGGVRIR